MKEIKTVTEGLPSGYLIEVKAKFGYDSWDGKDVVVIESVLTFEGDNVESVKSLVYKPAPNRKFFKKVSPEITWKEKCETEIKEHIDWLTSIAEDKAYREKITEGLFDSLVEVDAVD